MYITKEKIKMAFEEKNWDVGIIKAQRKITTVGFQVSYLRI